MSDKRQQLRHRLTEFALAIIDLVQTLPDEPEHQPLLVQLMRSGTCLGAKYTHACCSRRLGWFVSEMARVEVLAAETLCWLRLVQERKIVEAATLAPILTECEALLSLISRSLQAAERRQGD
jgi:four helix bundle protein